MKVTVEWKLIDDECEDLWDLTRCLYLYSSAEDQVLYIGQVGSLNSSVRRRWTRSGKGRCWDFLESELGIFEHRVTVGALCLPTRRRFSRQLLTDVETLLISCLAPPANSAARKSRISRPGMTVICTGDWFLASRKFVDR